MIFKSRYVIKRCEGFTLVELMVAMVVFVFVIAGASVMFSGLVTQFKQQSKIAETSIEGAMGLEILRKDIEHAGCGLPWNIPNGISYEEAAPGNVYNDTPPAAPRAVLSGNNAGMKGSDYLVLKSVNVSTSEETQKWTYVGGNIKGNNNVLREWEPDAQNMDSGTRVIVLTMDRDLWVNDSSFYTVYEGGHPAALRDRDFAPPDNKPDTRIVYGADPDNDLRMPYNRAEYFVSSSGVPKRCAPGTGVLKKGVINNSTGARGGIITSSLPLIDCIADMQLIFGLDMDGDGTIGTYTDGDSVAVGGPDQDEQKSPAEVRATFGNAGDIRNRLREVRVYILAHEGQKDPGYSYPEKTILVGDRAIGASLGSIFNVEAQREYRHYRWKLYTLAVKPMNLKGDNEKSSR